MNTYTKDVVKKTDTSCQKGSTALRAVAFQDHMLRAIGHLSLSDPLGTRVNNINPKRKNYKRDVKCVVNTGLHKNTPKKKVTEEQEYVLDVKPAPPTLAQRLGLVEAPKSHLSEEEWGQVKNQSNERKDSQDPCVICKEDFGTEQQVLLSCSHVFHRACLAAFERFSGRKSCPMCRREQYETRVIHEGSRQWRHKCATRIQAAWRGYVVHSWYKRFRQTVPPKDPQLRHKFYEQKLSTITERMVRSVDYDVNAFLTEIDRSLEASRDVFSHFDDLMRTLTDDEWHSIQLKAVERGHTDCPICLCALEREPMTSRDTTDQSERTKTSNSQSKHSITNKTTSSQSHNATSSNQATKTKTSACKQKTQTAKNHSTLSHSSKVEGQGDMSAGALLWRQKALLSCSHVFHLTCLQAFEELAEGERRFTCPVCRAHYQKKVLD